MQQISIDNDVFKIIRDNLVSFDETPNDVLRRLLGLDKSTTITRLSENPTESAAIPFNRDEREGLYTNGVSLPYGLKLRKYLHRTLHEAEVRDGYILYSGKRFKSPSAAGNAASGSSVNGWIFWEYFDLKSNRWLLLDNFRNP